MFTDDARGGERAADQLLGPLKAHSHGPRSAHSCNPRLRQKEISVGYLTQMKERLNVNFLTTICRQTVFVKKSF